MKHLDHSGFIIRNHCHDCRAINHIAKYFKQTTTMTNNNRASRHFQVHSTNHLACNSIVTHKIGQQKLVMLMLAPVLVALMMNLWPIQSVVMATNEHQLEQQSIGGNMPLTTSNNNNNSDGDDKENKLTMSNIDVVSPSMGSGEYVCSEWIDKCQLTCQL